MKTFNNLFLEISELSHIIYLNEESFTETLFPNIKMLMGITDIYLGSEVVSVKYILESGQHIADTIKVTDFLTWINILKSNEKSKN